MGRELQVVALPYEYHDFTPLAISFRCWCQNVAFGSVNNSMTSVRVTAFNKHFVVWNLLSTESFVVAAT